MDKYVSFESGCFSVLRWIAIGTASAVGFGIALGLLMGLPQGSIDVAIGGAIVGLVGGPIFGLAVGLGRSLRLEQGQGRGRSVLTFAVIGGGVFPAMLTVVGWIRSREISLRLDDDALQSLLEILFLAGTGAVFGGLFGLAFGGKTSKPKQEARDSLDEFLT